MTSLLFSCYVGIIRVKCNNVCARTTITCLMFNIKILRIRVVFEQKGTGEERSRIEKKKKKEEVIIN